MEEFKLATVKLWSDEEVAAVPKVKAVFDDIRATRKSDFINNFWRALANQPKLLERTWASVKQVMVEPGALDPLTKELIYIAVSATNIQLLRAFAYVCCSCERAYGRAVCRVSCGGRHGK